MRRASASEDADVETRRRSLLATEVEKFETEQALLRKFSPPSQPEPCPSQSESCPSPPEESQQETLPVEEPTSAPSPQSPVTIDPSKMNRRKSLQFESTADVVQEKLQQAFVKRNSIMMTDDNRAVDPKAVCDFTGEYECGYSDTVVVSVTDPDMKKEERYNVTFMHSSYGRSPTDGIVDRMHGTLTWLECIGRMTANGHITWGERSENASFWIPVNAWRRKEVKKRRKRAGNFEAVYERRRRSVEGLKMLFGDDEEEEEDEDDFAEFRPDF